jgi:hypothetical protein
LPTHLKQVPVRNQPQYRRCEIQGVTEPPETHKFFSWRLGRLKTMTSTVTYEQEMKQKGISVHRVVWIRKNPVSFGRIRTKKIWIRIQTLVNKNL